MTSYNPNAIFQLLVLAIFGNIAILYTSNFFGDFQLLVLAIFGNFSSSTAIFQLLVLAIFGDIAISYTVDCGEISP
jgi:hypothetical protein